MNPHAFLRSLQITDSFFPIGAFAYSDGLETAATAGLVRDGSSLWIWMEHFLNAVFVPCEGLALLKCMRALAANDVDALCSIDQELTAIRPARAVRLSSARVGKRLLSLYASTSKDEEFSECARFLPDGNAAAAYGVVFFHLGVAEREALLAFGYNRLAGIISAGLRLIAIGQQQGQALLNRALDRLPADVACILETSDAPLTSFNPLLDIQQMKHQRVYSRLFRS